MKKKFIKDISANTLQVVINQLSGLVIFYLLSTQLTKNEFGEINWALAVLLTSFGVLAIGIDQIAIRRIASGKDPAGVLSVYILHVLISGILFYLLLAVFEFIFPSFKEQHAFLLLLAIGKLMIFFSTPFKQLATGLEKFRLLLFMAICSNVVRSVTLIILALSDQIQITTVITIFITGDLAELILCYFLTRYVIKIPVILRWNKDAYIDLVKEALPQFGVAVFTSALSRLDWIFLGILVSNVIVAEYSFAYKVFEVATLPMLVVAPLLIPRFTKLFHSAAPEPPAEKVNTILVLLRFEMMIASGVALILNILWIPVIDLITQGKYGAVNSNTVLILSASMPFLYFNNFLWTVNFAKGHLKMIFYAFFISFLFNLAGNVILIPLLTARGAAIAYLVAIVAQTVIYISQTKLVGLKGASISLLLCPLCALAGALLASYLFNVVWLILVSGLFFYILLLFITRQLFLSDWLEFKRTTGF